MDNHFEVFHLSKSTNDSEVDPPKPSDRLSRLTLHPRVVEAQSGTASANLGKTIQGDLDWIIMKAMEKDRERRYGSAQALAEDLGRWLADEPIEARPPSFAYRLSKLARKHRRSLTIGLAIAIGVVLSAAVVGYGISERRAAHERTKAQAIRNRQLQQIVDLEKERVASLAYGNAMLAANESWINGRRKTTLELLQECPDRKGALSGIGKAIGLKTIRESWLQVLLARRLIRLFTLAMIIGSSPEVKMG